MDSRFELYNEIAALHQKHMDCIRFGQFMDNLRTWLRIEHGQDIFYVPDDKMLELVKEFVGEK